MEGNVMGTRFLLVDDHAIFRAGVRSLIESRHPDAELAEAGDGAAAIALAEEQEPNVIVIDLHLPDQNGIEVSRQILARSASARIIIISGESNLSYVHEALKAGVSAYLLKTGAAEELPQAINAALAGSGPTRRRSRSRTDASASPALRF